MQLDDKAIIAAVGEMLAEERAARVELQARVAELTDQLRTPGEPGRDGRDGLHGLPGPVGERGVPGERGDAGPAGPTGDRGDPGEKGNPGDPAYPGEARGLWIETETYRAMDVVAYNGSEWRAVYDNPGPLPGDGWKQGAKGVKGKPGERGERGDRGQPGPEGRGIADLFVSDDGELLIVRLSDGTQRSIPIPVVTQ